MTDTSKGSILETNTDSRPEIKLDSEKQNLVRKKYSKPQLECLGDLRSKTLGGSAQPDLDSGWPGNPYGDYQKLGP